MLGGEIENDALCIVTSVVQSCYFSRVIKLFRATLLTTYDYHLFEDYFEVIFLRQHLSCKG